jgi:nitronate monooxygenase
MSSWQPTAFSRRIGIRTPIVQGPFGGGLSSVPLVAAVNHAGGLGSFGVHHQQPADILRTAEAIRAVTAEPFALNLWVPVQGIEWPEVDEAQWRRATDLLLPLFQELKLDVPDKPKRETAWPYYEAQIDALLEARPPVFSFVFGIPSADVLTRCRSLGIVTMGAATTAAEARALEDAGVDMVVASGCEAGGHRVAFLEAPERNLIGTMALIPQVRDAVRIPVIAAGGIVDGRGVAAAMALGADGVQIGTAFLACEESGAGALHRTELFGPLAGQTALTRGFSGRLARGLRNPMLRLFETAPADAVLPYPVQNWLTAQLKRAAIAQGRADLMSLWSGQGAPLLRHHKVADLMQALTTGQAH